MNSLLKCIPIEKGFSLLPNFFDSLLFMDFLSLTVQCEKDFLKTLPACYNVDRSGFCSIKIRWSKKC